MSSDKKSRGSFFRKLSNWWQDVVGVIGMYTELYFYFERRQFLKRLPVVIGNLPKGDGHPVIVIPGIAGNDESTKYLRDALEQLGYKAYGWGLGMNKGPNMADQIKLMVLLNKIYREHKQKVSVIGWSMGGIFAREMAREEPNMVRRVITLASPFAANVEKHISRLILKEFCALSGYDKVKTQKGLDRTRRTPPVNCTAIYSRTDAVVNWEACCEEDVPHAESIETTGTHWGMVHNIQAFEIIAHRLYLPVHQLKSS